MIIKVGDQYKVRESATGPEVIATITRITSTPEGTGRAVYYKIVGQEGEKRDTGMGFKMMLDWAATLVEHDEMDI